MSKAKKNTLLEFKKVNFGYKPKNLILHDISFTIQKGEYVCITGANGCGKSTLGNIIAGLFKPVSGSILLNNKEINKKNVWDLKTSTGIVFENPDNQFIGETVEDDIAFGLENKCVERSKMQPLINKVANYVGITDLLKSEPKNLSGGQKQLAAIASILVLDPSIIVFDEVTSMLDNQAKTNINNLMSSLKKQNKTIINITHDMEEVSKADKVIVLADGRIKLIGTPQEVFNNKQLSSLSLDKPFVYKLEQTLGTKLAKRINYEK